MKRMRKTEECNICKSNKFKVLVPRDVYWNGWINDVVRCLECELVFRVFLPENKIISWTYKSQLSNSPDYPADLSPGRVAILTECANCISRFRNLNRILDVGAGTGFFLKICKEKRWGVWGVEKNIHLVEIADREHDIKIKNGNYEDTNFPENFFDVVSFLNVIEHLSDPLAALKKAYYLLRPGGGILLRFPNASFHVPLYILSRKISKLPGKIKFNKSSVIYHYAYSNKTIKRCLTNIGFRNIILKNSATLHQKNSSINIYRPCITFGLNKILANLVHRLSFGNLYIGSSLIVTANK